MHRKQNKWVSYFFCILYFILLGLGIHAAYTGRWVVALFWAITCAGESIAVSIDHWPRGKGQ